jgi:protein SCO1/2
MSAAALARVAASVGGLALAVTLGVMMMARSIRPRAPLPVLGHVPSFRLVDEKGAPFTSEAMLGHTNVVDFIFTRCPSACPRLTATMARLESRLQQSGQSAGDVRFVSISVDPENDTPAVLADYAMKANADLSRWTFATGPADEVSRAVVLGFKVSAAKVARQAGDYDVIHGNWLVLVDRKGDFRGYYQVEGDTDFEALFGDVRRVEREK